MNKEMLNMMREELKEMVIEERADKGRSDAYDFFILDILEDYLEEEENESVSNY